MKYLYLILLILSFNFLKTYGQTPAAEVKNLAKKFENKEFDIYSYKKKADIWHEINSKYSYP